MSDFLRNALTRKEHYPLQTQAQEDTIIQEKQNAGLKGLFQ